MYRLPRRKRLASLGRVDAVTLDEARITALGYFAKAATNEDPQDLWLKRRTLKTVAELCDLFIEHHAKKKRLSWKSDQSALAQHILPKLAARTAMNITSADIAPIHSEFGAKHPYGANTLLAIVRVMFNWGKIAGYLPANQVNPVFGITKFPERRRRRYLTTVEMPQFIQALEVEDSEYVRHGLWLLLLMGIRSKELLKAKWTDIDSEMSTLFVGLTKNGEPLLAPISEAAMERLKAIPRIPNNPYILCGRKSGWHLGNLGRGLRRVLCKAALENVRVHDLRRTVGSWLAHAGHSLHLIGDVLNHRDLKTTAGYA